LSPSLGKNIFLEMQFQFFRIPAASPESLTEELNRFVRGHRILSVQRELVQESGGVYWAVCVEYLPAAPGGGTNAAQSSGSAGKPKVDYKEVLSETDFAVFSRLRQLRKEVAEREGLPVYAVFTNEQIAAMVSARVDSLGAMQKIEGVGESRIEKYGALFLSLLKSSNGASHEEDRKPAA